MSRIPPELAATVAAIVDAGSLDGAAAELGLTPSAVSQRLKALERQLGQVLIVRARPARATSAGESVIKLARQTALLERDTRNSLGLVTEGGPITVPLAVNADSLSTWFLPPLARLADEHGIRFDLHRDDQSFTARLLESGEVMAAVTSEAEPVAGCTVTTLGVLVYQAVASPQFAQRWFPAGVTADALRTAPFVDFDRRDALQQLWLQSRGVDPTGVPRHYVPASHDYAAAVLLGLGWGMLPTIQVPTAMSTGSVVPLGGADREVPLYWQQWDLRSPLLDAIAAEVLAEAERVLVRP